MILSREREKKKVCAKANKLIRAYVQKGRDGEKKEKSIHPYQDGKGIGVPELQNPRNAIWDSCIAHREGKEPETGRISRDHPSMISRWSSQYDLPRIIPVWSPGDHLSMISQVSSQYDLPVIVPVWSPPGIIPVRSPPGIIPVWSPPEIIPVWTPRYHLSMISQWSSQYDLPRGSSQYDLPWGSSQYDLPQGWSRWLRVWREPAIGNRAWNRVADAQIALFARVNRRY